MINEKMEALGRQSSVIRALFEYGKKRKAEIGNDNVFDFSIGNPSIPAPEIVNDTIRELVNTMDPVVLHGYTSAAGDMSVRKVLAENIKRRFGTEAKPELIYMTCGAAASLTISLNAICLPGEEVIVIAPYFPEYKVFIEKAGAKVIEVPSRIPDFQLDLEAVEKAINAGTKAVIINSPNNPTGAVLSAGTISKLSELLNRKQKEFGHEIFIIADEPYRELVYGGAEVPYIPEFYDNTIVCYSYSKSLSLPGERIGYIFVSPKCADAGSVYAAVCGAGRALGFVCAPSLLQFTVARCCNVTSDIARYDENRAYFYKALTDIGYEVVPPDGAFYLFVKALEPDANAFSEKAKERELLLVPSDSFGFKGYVRISYCVTKEQIERSIPAFRKLYEDYQEK